MKVTADGDLISPVYWCGFYAAKVDVSLHGTYYAVHTVMDALETHCKKCPKCAGRYYHDEPV